MKRVTSSTTTLTGGQARRYRPSSSSIDKYNNMLLRPHVQMSSTLRQYLPRLPDDLCLLITDFTDHSIDGQGFIPSEIELRGINLMLSPSHPTCSLRIVHHPDEEALQRVLFSMLLATANLPPRPHLVVCRSQAMLDEWASLLTRMASHHRFTVVATAADVRSDQIHSRQWVVLITYKNLKEFYMHVCNRPWSVVAFTDAQPISNLLPPRRRTIPQSKFALLTIVQKIECSMKLLGFPSKPHEWNWHERQSLGLVLVKPNANDATMTTTSALDLRGCLKKVSYDCLAP
jgi:hypothetical protein